MRWDSTKSFILWLLLLYVGFRKDQKFKFVEIGAMKIAESTEAPRHSPISLFSQDELEQKSIAIFYNHQSNQVDTHHFGKAP